MRRARTWRWARVFPIRLLGWYFPPTSDPGITWAHEQSYALARCWAACIVSIRSRPFWPDRVFADHNKEIGVLPIGLLHGEFERRNMRRFKFLHGRPVQNDAAFPKRSNSPSMRRVALRRIIKGLEKKYAPLVTWRS